ncbi:MAG: MnhB domain-containing protein [Acidimicrobiia bacterium]
MKTPRPSAILQHGIVAASGPILAFSLYLLFAGHNQPGGGFAGGLVAGVLVVLVWASGGPETVQRLIPIGASTLAGGGLMVSAGAGFASMVVGLDYLESGYFQLAVPLVGTVKFVSPLLFDIGVYLVVLGMSLGLVGALGEEGSLNAATEPEVES